jgi:hypothetical protein
MNIEELKGAFTKSAQGEWRHREVGNITYITCNDKLIASDAKTTGEENILFIALAHNLMPDLLEAAYELNRLADEVVVPNRTLDILSKLFYPEDEEDF